MDLLSRLNNDSTLIRARLEVLTRQSASGRRSERLGDIAPEAPRAINLSNDIARRTVYTRSIDQAQGRIEVTQATLKRLKDIASEFRTDIAMRLDAKDPQALATVQARARSAALEVGNLLNSTMDGEYLLGGSDLKRPPVPDAANLLTSTMATSIAAAIGSLDNSNAAGVSAATLAAAQDTSPGGSIFSTFLEDPATGGTEPRRSVPSGDAQLVAYGVIANRNALARSEGDTTGSWSRDLLRGLFSLAGLTPAQAQQEQGFGAIADSIRNIFTSAENALAEEQGSLGAISSQLQAQRGRHSNISDTLRSQLVDITDVDLAATLTRLQSTQNALQASYRATSNIASLTLTNFLK